MSVLILVSDYGAFREVSLSACYHSVPLSQTGACLNEYMGRLDLPPVRAELYLSEVAYDRLSQAFAGCGVELDSTLPASSDGDLADLYETLTPVRFEQLQAILQNRARLVGSFARQNVLAA